MKAIQGLLKDEGENLSKLILSSSADVKQINKKIITYFIAKLCYSDNDTSSVRLCDVMDKSIVSTDTLITGIQQIRFSTYVYVCNRNKYN